jgi:hypothetical protein
MIETDRSILMCYQRKLNGMTKERYQLWYLRDNEKITGPFPTGLIQRYLLLGRLHTSDEVSIDGTHWRKIKDFAGLIPDELILARSGDAEPLRRAQLREDERAPGDRRGDRANTPDERRNGDRRRSEGQLIKQHRRLRAELNVRPQKRQAILIAALALVIAVGTLVALTAEKNYDTQITRRDCGAEPAPKVDWSNCRISNLDLPGADLHGVNWENSTISGARLDGANLSASDLSYIDLQSASLIEVNLSKVRLIGANLRGADLRFADLSDSDLSYANLTGAKLDSAHLAGARLAKAIWIDGTECPADAVGRCNP